MMVVAVQYDGGSGIISWRQWYNMKVVVVQYDCGGTI